MNLPLDPIRRIESVMIIDDKADARESMSEVVQDADLNPVLLNRSIPTFSHLEKELQSVDAAIFDHHLKIGKYAGFNGAEAVSHLYEKGFPALLITNFAEAELEKIRIFRSKIPVVISGSAPSPDAIKEGLSKCINEFSGVFSDDRKPWRTLVRVEEVHPESNSILVQVPGWSSEIVKLDIENLPKNLQSSVKPDERYFAKVNVGAKHYQDLYFSDFQSLTPPTEEDDESLHN